MKKKDKEKKTDIKHSDLHFSGYTMEELRYQIAMVSIKKEFLKERAMESTEAIKKQFNSHVPFRGLGPRGLFGKVMKGLDVVDYIMIGYQGLRAFRRIGSIFRRR